MIAKDTYVGDANLDGQVDALDYEQVDLNIGNGVGQPLGSGSPLATLESGRFIPEPAALSYPLVRTGLPAAADNPPLKLRRASAPTKQKTENWDARHLPIST